MSHRRSQFILGSRSPHRLQLLRHVVDPQLIEVLPARSAEEAGFAGLNDWAALEQRLKQIVREKYSDVLEQRQYALNDGEVVITADTIIVISESDDRLAVLRQPPNDDTWPQTVRRWFRQYYAGRTHVAVTALCVATSVGEQVERVVKSEVTFRPDVNRWLDWYISTNEPRGKAGGYAIQGLGSVFVSHVQGSLSNVVGLPLEELLNVFKDLGISVSNN